MKISIANFGFSLNIIFAFLLLLSYLNPFVAPDTFWPLAFVGLAFSYLVTTNFIFLIYWSLRRSRKVFLSLILLVAGYSDISKTIRLTPNQNITGEKTKVLSYNVHHFISDWHLNKGNNPQIVKYLKSTNASIICLQEARIFKTGKLSLAAINDELPLVKYYQVSLVNSSSGSVTFSKYPIVNMGEIRFPDSFNHVMYSDIKISDNQTVRVYNCHLQSYEIDPEDYSVVDFSDNDGESQKMEQAKKISLRLKSGFIHRASQARRLAEHIKHSPYPVIVCGDFNDTPVSYVYHEVSANLKDAFLESGWGISNTYNGKLPSFRIDYIFSASKFGIADYKREKVNYSDHYPISCNILFKKSALKK